MDDYESHCKTRDIKCIAADLRRRRRSAAIVCGSRVGDRVVCSRRQAECVYEFEGLSIVPAHADGEGAASYEFRAEFRDS